MLLAACGSAHLRAADAALERGDRPGALSALEAGCRADPADEACGRAEALRSEVRASVVLSCSEGAMACAEALRPWEAVDDPILARLAAEAGATHADSCPEGGLERIVCLEELPLRDAAWERRKAGEREKAATSLAELAAPMDEGAASLLLSTAACLDPAFRPRAHVAEEAFRAAARLPIAARFEIHGTPPPDPCTLVERHPGARCSPEGDVLHVAGKLGEERSEVRTEERHHRYVAATYEFPNPAHAAAEARLIMAKQMVEEAKVHEELAEATCREAERAYAAADHCFDCSARRHKDLVCEQARVLSRARSDRDSERRDAEFDLRGTPATLRQHAWANYVQRIERHVFERPWELRVELPGATPRAPGGTFRHEDTRSAAFLPAKIAEDPLQLPDFEAEFSLRMQQEALAALREALGAKARARRADCPMPARLNEDWLQCDAEATLWSGEPARLLVDVPCAGAARLADGSR